MKRIRKAVGAGLAAAVSWAAGQWTTDTPTNGGEWALFIVGALAAGAIAGVAVYNLRNEDDKGPMPHGSDPKPPETFTTMH